MHFITTGCSFTAGTIPLPHNLADNWKIFGNVWPHFCFAEMNTNEDQFVNLALSGGGNISASANLIYYLETNKHQLTHENTLIGINLTGLHRWDTICEVDNVNANKDLCCIDPTGIDHFSKQLGFGWITEGIDYEHPRLNIDLLNCLSVLQCFSYLELNKFRYFFMIMNNDIYNFAPAWFQQVLDSRHDSWIKFNAGPGMMEFVKQQNLTRSATDFHPSTQGHQLIAQIVINFLNKKYNRNELH